MEASNVPTTAAKRLPNVLRAARHMLSESISNHKLTGDVLHLLLRGGKLAGKALANLLTTGHHYSTTAPGGAANFYSALSCRYMDPDTAVYSPVEVEFSCSDTPSYPSFYSLKRESHRRRRRRPDYYHVYDAATVTTASEHFNSGDMVDTESLVSSPSPPAAAVVRQLRVTDSPFPVKEEGEADGFVDRAAEEFIRRFYEQLRLQQYVATAGKMYGGRQEPVVGRG